MRFLRDGWRRVAQAARLMVGVPDYEAYVTHRRLHHPAEPVMSLADFHRDRIERRYGVGKDSPPRCC